MSRKLVPLLALILLTLFDLTVATDETRTEKAFGQDVVEATVELISKSKVFPEDYFFLYRVAYVETHFGFDDDTFTDDEFKGIWRLREKDYNKTKQEAFKELHAFVLKRFNITWRKTNFKQLNTPIYSALAARLFMATFPQEIPQTKTSQSHYWHKYYTQKPNITGSYFRQEMKNLEEETPPCEGKLDLAVVLTGSGGSNGERFDKTKAIVANWFETFSNNTEIIRKALIVSNTITPIFDLSNDLTEQEMRDKIFSIYYPNIEMNSNRLINSAIDLFENAPPRPGVPRVLTVVVHGSSGGRLFNARQAQRDNMTPLIIAIGNSTKKHLKISLSFRNRVYSLNSYEALAEFLEPMHEKMCEIPQQPGNATVEDTLAKGEKRFYEYDVPQDGITVSLKTNEGSTTGYYSYDNENPSCANYDGVLGYSTFIPHPHQNKEEEEEDKSKEDIPDGKVFLSIKGTGAENRYEIESVEGYVSSFPVIGIVFIIIGIVIVIMAGGIIAMIVVMRRRAGEGEREMLIQKPTKVTKGG